jgi:chromosome segregation ATPase
MNFPNPAPLSKLLENFYTFNQSLERLEKDLEALNREVSGLRTDCTDLAMRVAVLEESRKTIEAQMRAVVAETVADLRVKFAEAQADLRVKQYQTDQSPALPESGKSREDSEG